MGNDLLELEMVQRIKYDKFIVIRSSLFFFPKVCEMPISRFILLYSIWYKIMYVVFLWLKMISPYHSNGLCVLKQNKKKNTIFGQALV